MAGYGVYEGIGGIPYSVGGTGQPMASQGVGGGAGSGGAPMAKPTQEQATPGSYGASGYAALMPQWMQDYFDMNLAGEGGESLNRQRDLAVNQLGMLKSQYGEQAALNPYFSQQGQIPKGFDPFNNNVFTNESFELNPVTQQTNSTKRDPFSGQSLGMESFHMAKEAGGPPMGDPNGYDMMNRPYTGKDFRRDALTGGLYSSVGRGGPGLLQANKDFYNKAKKLW